MVLLDKGKSFPDDLLDNPHTLVSDEAIPLVPGDQSWGRKRIKGDVSDTDLERKLASKTNDPPEVTPLGRSFF